MLHLMSISHIPAEWALPDQLVYSTVSALLRMASAHPRYSAAATEAVCAFISDVVNNIKTGDREPALMYYLS